MDRIIATLIFLVMAVSQASAADYSAGLMIEDAVKANSAFEAAAAKRDEIYERISRACAPTYSCTTESDRAVRESGIKEANNKRYEACKAVVVAYEKKPVRLTERQHHDLSKSCPWFSEDANSAFCRKNSDLCK